MFSWLSLGNLRNRGNAGLWYVNGNNGTGNTRWNIGSRLSGQQLKNQLYNFRRDYPPCWQRAGIGLGQLTEMALRPLGQ